MSVDIEDSGWRGSGRTTRQMESAPREAVFVWVHGDVTYAQKLARKIGREDLKIVGPSWLDEDRWRGLELTGIVIDHACHLTERQVERLSRARGRVR